MSIFDLHGTVLADYSDFVRSFLAIADPRAREFVGHTLETERRLWPDVLLQVSPSYARAENVDALEMQGVLDAETARIFRNAKGEALHLYRHQAEALGLAARKESYVVTSGTGSGKSLAYFLPQDMELVVVANSPVGWPSQFFRDVVSNIYLANIKP